MTTIHIKRSHDLGLEDVRAKVDVLAQSLGEQLQADCQWQGDRLVFERPGASGTIEVAPDYVDVEINLGLVLALMQGPIEQRVNDMLDNALS